MLLIPDDPIIRCIEQTGYPPWISDKEPVCPVCHEGCDTFYRDDSGDIVGCNNCLTAYDAWEEMVE